MRKLEVTTAGKWYLLLTIALGVVALVSANNVLFLVESLLLAGLILSGVLSERAISSVRIRVIRAQAVAGEPTRDPVLVSNESRGALFCIEVGEWTSGRFESYGFLPRLEPRSTGELSSHQRLSTRGMHRWQCLGIATSYPFGFARKIRLISTPGERLVWPQRVSPTATAGAEGERVRRRPAGTELVEGEARPFQEGDDLRRVIWSVSAKGESLWVRPYQPPRLAPRVRFDCRGSEGAEFEGRVRDAARQFHEAVETAEPEGELELVSGRTRRIRGSRPALDALAKVRAS